MDGLWRDVITAHHDDGTDYINEELERRVFDAISPRYAFLAPNSLAPIAAIRVVLDWLNEHGTEEDSCVG